MTPELEQLADEAIELRCTNIDRAIGTYRLPAVTITDPAHQRPTRTVDHLDRARAILATTWASHRPALAQLANDRLAGIARLADRRVTPAAGCIVTVGRVTLEAVSDLHPVSHRYEVMRGRDRAGSAWLSSWQNATPYVADLSGQFFLRPTLHEVIEEMAERLNAVPLAEAGAR